MLPDITLPIDAVTQRFAWMGRTGSGKRYAAMKLAELMLTAGAQVVVFDIPGHWAGLRLGPTPFEIPVFGGTRGDIPLEPAGGAAVADLVENSMCGTFERSSNGSFGQHRQSLAPLRISFIQPTFAGKATARAGTS